jgi:leader peptidase (prepilin peptidase)/N-methyltransferase
VDYLTESAAFIFGLCVGSFLNVCIYRLPDESKSINRPRRSVCPHCDHPISIHDNIPVVSYVLLKGRCRHCHESISLRYPLIELISAGLALGAVITFGPNLKGLVYYMFLVCLVVVTFIDLDHRIIPDVITLPGIPIFFLAALAVGAVAWRDAVLGVFLGGGILLLVAWGYKMATGKEGMGGGDIKLLAMMGGLLGWKGVFFTVIVSSLLGTFVGIIVMVLSKKDMKLAVPFGPFLSAGAMLYLFFGQQMIFWYFSWLPV